MTMRRPTHIALLIIGAIAVAGVSRADSIGVRMEVTANVVTNCRVVVPPLSFGTYDPLDVHATQPADAAVNLTLMCTRNTGAAVSFDYGLHAPSGTNRSMSGPGPDTLHYQIYRDAARSQIWAQGTEAMRVTSHGVGTPDQLTVFGRIPPRQEVEPGAYTDVLTATVEF